MTKILAIDPGKAGGFALHDGETVTTWPMPQTDGDVVDLLVSIKEQHPDVEVVIEQVRGYAGKAQPGSAMFRFGWGVGGLHHACLALGIRLTQVTPQRWQRAIAGLGIKGGRQTREWKNALKAEAQRRYPEQRVTLKTCDALLILDWALAQRGS